MQILKILYLDFKENHCYKQYNAKWWIEYVRHPFKCSKGLYENGSKQETNKRKYDLMTNE
uniref:Uncharacterized protein n=1 Tax=Arion vulgaris TaxID=1028688 RepID=A0A0B6ZT12_9EUPU